MTLYDAWASRNAPVVGRDAARAAIARGQVRRLPVPALGRVVTVPPAR